MTGFGGQQTLSECAFHQIGSFPWRVLIMESTPILRDYGDVKTLSNSRDS